MSFISIPVTASARSAFALCGLVWLAWMAPALADDPAPAAAVEPASQSTFDPLQHRYELGSGWALGRSGFTLGGYAEAVYADPAGRNWEAGLNALSAMLWWEGSSRWSFFSEVELERPLLIGQDDAFSDDQDLILERLHLDYAHGDALKLRVGKFLTPVGRWNIIHAPPLTWTSSRPLITEATFPTNATGGMVYGVLPWTEAGIEYSLYASPGEEIAPEDELDTFSEAYGGRVAATLLPHTQFGLSYVSFEQSSSDEHKQLLSADFLWSWRRFELSGEYVRRSIEREEDHPEEYGHYVQFVAPLTQKLYGVARYEGFRAADTSRGLSVYLGGLNYRVRSGLVLKAEYSRATNDPIGVDDGLLASIAVLF